MAKNDYFHISIRKQLFCHDEVEMVGHILVDNTPPLFTPLGYWRNLYSISQQVWVVYSHDLELWDSTLRYHTPGPLTCSPYWEGLHF